MKTDEKYIEWLVLTSELIEKYDLDNISIKVEGHFSLNKDLFSATYKEYVKINAKSDDNRIIKNEYYDILENNKNKKVKDES